MLIENWIITFLLNKKNLLFNVLSILTFAMLIDYITGMLDAKKERYIVIVLVAIITDYLIYTISKKLELSFKSQTIFGILVSIWLIINELISILENSSRLGAKLPVFLQKVLSELKKDIENV